MSKIQIFFSANIFLPISVLLVFSASPAVAALDGQTIMKNYEEARRIPQFRAKAKLSTVKAGGQTKEKTFTLWRKIKDDGIRYRSVTRFHSPAEVKNEAILFLENDLGENDILLYLPAYQKVRRLERSQQNSSFMGSDFSYSDITSPHADDFKTEAKGEIPCPGSTKACYRVEGVPANDSVKDRTGYSKVVSFVQKDNFLVVRSENFGLDGALLKTVTFSDPEKQASGRWFQKRIEVDSKKSGGKTTLQFSELLTNANLEDALFTQQALSKGAK